MPTKPKTRPIEKVSTPSYKEVSFPLLNPCGISQPRWSGIPPPLGISVPADHMDSAPVSDTICNSRPYWILSALPHRAHGFTFGYPGENFPGRSPIPGLLPPEHA
ncbi:hypothetical protein E3N88_18622 [Mikania micrantha]|uniref:Uncharacterized protein n=1 Tax=Mikania micrantha TaxID=192012 RepID=A0A5N6NKY9_9ASTR|nr:hypothetical protein E3N88_18622 [Mikania micrantha]